MNIEQATQATVKIFNKDPQLPICWVGGAGIGKTTQAKALIDQLTKARTFVYAPVRTDDALGLNLPNKTRSKVEFIPHTRMKQAVEEPCLIYIDELNRADRYSRAALMELIGERTIGGQSIHPLTCLLLTMNHESEAYDVAESDVAFKTRVVAMPIQAEARVAAKWAKAQSYKAMHKFLLKYPHLLNEEFKWERPRPDPRLLSYLERFRACKTSVNNEVMDFVLSTDYAEPFYLTENDKAEDFADFIEKEIQKHSNDTLLGLSESLFSNH